MPKIRMEQARDVIQRLAAERGHTQDDERLIADLERTTGVSIAELAELSNRWAPG